MLDWVFELSLTPKNEEVESPQKTLAICQNEKSLEVALFAINYLVQ